MEGFGIEVCGEGVGQPPSSAAESEGKNAGEVQKRKRQINKKKIMETKLECLRLALDYARAKAENGEYMTSVTEVVNIADRFYGFIKND